jgi:hypothetical protein
MQLNLLFDGKSNSFLYMNKCFILKNTLFNCKSMLTIETCSKIFHLLKPIYHKDSDAIIKVAWR